MKDFIIRQSSVKTFYTCPAKYKYGLEWDMSKELVPDFFKYGTEAHAIMEGIDGDYLPRSVEYASILKNKLDAFLSLGFTIVERETRELVPIYKGVLLSRQIDALAKTHDGTLVVIDYKTASSEWKKVATNIYPEAMGVQSAAYLFKSPRYEEWAKVMVYLVTSVKENIFYEWSKEDEQNLIDAIRMIKNATKFPKMRGYNCHYCPFKSMCYEVKGWENSYTHR